MSTVTARRPLDAHVCLALYRASHAFTGLYRRLLEPFGLTYPQYIVLLALSESPPLSVKDLGAAMDLDSGTLSPLLRRLEGEGLVRKERSAEDSRVVRVELTERGHALRAELSHVAEQAGACSGLSAAGAKDLLRSLNHLTVTLRAADRPDR